MENKQKILVFHPAIAPYRIRLFNELSRAFDATICLYYKNLKSQKFDYEKIEEQFRFTPHYFEKSLRLGGRTLYLGHRKWIRNEKPDAVIVSEYGLGLWVALFQRAFSAKKYKLFTICDDSKEMAQKRKGLRKIARDIAVNHIDGIILCNEDAAEYYSQFSASVFVFPIIQDEDDYNLDKEDALKQAQQLFKDIELKGRRIFLFVGRLSPEKNLPYLLRSFVYQHSNHPENILFLVGGESTADPKLGEKLQNIIDDNDANEYIRLVGRKEGTDLKAWYSLGQALILPSIQEAFGAVVNEALLAGQYVMVSNAAGASCLVNDENGEVVDIGRPYIDFERACSRIKPLNDVKSDRNSKMPYTFDTKMKALLTWLRRSIDAQPVRGGKT